MKKRGENINLRFNRRSSFNNYTSSNNNYRSNNYNNIKYSNIFYSKKASAETDAYFIMFEIMVVVLIAVALFFYINSVAKDTSFEKKYMALDLGLLMSVVETSPGFLHLSYIPINFSGLQDNLLVDVWFRNSSVVVKEKKETLDYKGKYIQDNSLVVLKNSFFDVGKPEIFKIGNKILLSENSGKSFSNLNQMICPSVNTTVPDWRVSKKVLLKRIEPVPDAKPIVSPTVFPAPHTSEGEIPLAKGYGGVYSLAMAGGDPYLRAFLRMIAKYESGAPKNGVSPYRILVNGLVVSDPYGRYGGSISAAQQGVVTKDSGHFFNGYSGHPEISVQWHSSGSKSTAAGRYQFLAGTWKKWAVNTPNGVNDFSPANQDLAVYKFLEGKGVAEFLHTAGANPDVNSKAFGDVWEKIMAGPKDGFPDGKAIGKVWASLPYACYENQGCYKRDSSLFTKSAELYAGLLKEELAAPVRPAQPPLVVASSSQTSPTSPASPAQSSQSSSSSSTVSSSSSSSISSSIPSSALTAAVSFYIDSNIVSGFTVGDTNSINTNNNVNNLIGIPFDCPALGLNDIPNPDLVKSIEGSAFNSEKSLKEEIIASSASMNINPAILATHAALATELGQKDLCHDSGRSILTNCKSSDCSNGCSSLQCSFGSGSDREQLDCIAAQTSKAYIAAASKTSAGTSSKFDVCKAYGSNSLDMWNCILCIQSDQFVPEHPTSCDYQQSFVSNYCLWSNYFGSNFDSSKNILFANDQTVDPGVVDSKLSDPAAAAAFLSSTTYYDRIIQTLVAGSDGTFVKSHPSPDVIIGIGGPGDTLVDKGLKVFISFESAHPLADRKLACLLVNELLTPESEVEFSQIIPVSPSKLPQSHPLSFLDASKNPNTIAIFLDLGKFSSSEVQPMNIAYSVYNALNHFFGSTSPVFYFSDFTIKAQFGAQYNAQYNRESNRESTIIPVVPVAASGDSSNKDAT